MWIGCGCRSIRHGIAMGSDIHRIVEYKNLMRVRVEDVLTVKRLSFEGKFGLQGKVVLGNMLGFKCKFESNFGIWELA